MRNKTQERVEELARERAATAIDLALVEDGIEFGKKMMAEMIANYTRTGREPRSRRRAPAVGGTARSGTAGRWRLSQRGEIAITPNCQLPTPKGRESREPLPPLAATTQRALEAAWRLELGSVAEAWELSA